MSPRTTGAVQYSADSIRNEEFAKELDSQWIMCAKLTKGQVVSLGEILI
jgi:hypothetical protein